MNNNKSLLIIGIIIMIVSSIISVNATSYLYNGDEVSYDNTNTEITSTNVQGAIDEVYDYADKYVDLNSRITSLENALPSKSTTNPLMNGTASIGSLKKYAPADHVHPSDTTKANLDSPTFTGTPTAPTAAASTNTTQLATTAFVKTIVDNSITNITGARTYKGPDVVAVGTAKHVSIASVSLTAGSYIVYGAAHFASNATGYRFCYMGTGQNVSTGASNYVSRNRMDAVNGAATICTVVGRLDPTATTTYYLNAYQNSGGDLNVRGRLYIVRIK